MLASASGHELKAETRPSRQVGRGDQINRSTSGGARLLLYQAAC